MSQLFDIPPSNSQDMSNDWYTPPKYIESARVVMGGIDLDPASSTKANEVVRATKYYTIRDNGLMQPWAGNIWINPPYGRTNGGSVSLQAEFVRKLLREWHARTISKAILLCTADPDEKWFQPLFEFPLCFAYPHIHFFRPGLPSETHIMGSCFVAIGCEESKFIQAFSPFGRIVKTIDDTKVHPIARELWTGGVA